MTAELTAHVLTRRRQTKFTPERIQQIRNLVERGKGREEIAELVGVTLGSLQVTCSRLGVSLRRPTFNTGVGLLRRGAPGPNGTGNHHSDDGSTPAPHQERAKKMNEGGSANFAIRMQYKGEERTIELPLTQDMIGQLAFEAELRNMRIGELIGELTVAIVKKDLFQTVLQREEPN